MFSLTLMATPTSSTMSKDAAPEFAYLPPPREDFTIREEGLKEKLIRKTKDNPFVPFGVALTTFALTFGLWQMKTGNKHRSQSMMRLRIVGQSFTIFAVLGGVLYGSRASASKSADKK